MQSHKSIAVKEACSSLSLHQVPWAYMKFHELAWRYMSLYAVPFFVWAAHKNFAVLVKQHNINVENFLVPPEHVPSDNVGCSGHDYFALHQRLVHPRVLTEEEAAEKEGQVLWHRGQPWAQLLHRGLEDSSRTLPAQYMGEASWGEERTPRALKWLICLKCRT